MLNSLKTDYFKSFVSISFIQNASASFFPAVIVAIVVVVMVVICMLLGDAPTAPVSFRISPLLLRSTPMLLRNIFLRIVGSCFPYLSPWALFTFLHCYCFSLIPIFFHLLPSFSHWLPSFYYLFLFFIYIYEPPPCRTLSFSFRISC